MTCIRIQSMITPFIEDKLGNKDMEIFLDHVASCKDCREELGIYYALLTAMKQLDEDKDMTGDFEQELNEKLERAREKLLHERYTYYRKKVVLIFLMILMVFIFGISYSERKLDKEEQVTESDFRIRNEFRDHNDHEIELQLQNYLKEHGTDEIQPE